MRVLFRIGHFNIHVFGVAIAVGILAGLWIMLKEAKRKGLDHSKILDFAIYTIIVSIIGARLYYVSVFYPDYYRQNPLEIFSVYNGGMSIQGALIAGIIFAVLYTGRTGMNFRRTADAFAPGIILGQAIGRIGCDVFGIPMDKAYPWGVMVGSKLLHPVQLYEALLNLALFTYLWWSRGRTKYDGQLFIRYLIGFSLIRAAVEFFRTNPVVIGSFTVVHVTSLAVIAASIVAGWLLKRREKGNKPDTGEGPLRVSLVEYLLIVAGGAVGTLIYFSIY